MLSAASCNKWWSEEILKTKEIVRTEGTVEPEADLAAAYEIKYQQFRRIYPTVKDLF